MPEFKKAFGDYLDIRIVAEPASSFQKVTLNAKDRAADAQMLLDVHIKNPFFAEDIDVALIQLKLQFKFKFAVTDDLRIKG